MRHQSIFTLLCCLFIFSACEEEVEPSIDFTGDLAFFPLELNRPLFYELDSIVLFNTIQGIVYDTTSAEVRETLVEEFVSADGETVYRGERWQRKDSASPWLFSKTYTVRRTPTTAITQEDNLSFTKLVFPISEGRSWNGNAAFDEGRDLIVGGEFLDVYNGWDYRYEAIEESITLATGLVVNNAVLVHQASEDNLIDQRVAFERYASGIGLVERFIDARATQCRTCCNLDFALCGNLSWDEKAEKGFILRQTLLRTE